MPRQRKPAATKKPAAFVGKAALCEALGWTRPRLDRRLEDDATFPVKRRGSRAGGWKFDVAQIVAYLARNEDGEDAIEDASKNAPGAAHRGESTAAQRLKNAQAARVEDALRREWRELIEAEEMRMVLGTMLARLGKGLDSLGDMVTKRLGLPEEASDVVREIVDDLRQNMVNDLRSLLGTPG